MAAVAVDVAGRLAGQGIGVTVVDPRWVKPVDPALLGAAAKHRLVVTVEDNGLVGGFGEAVARLMREADLDLPVRTFGLPQAFLAHGERTEILHDAGLSPQNLALSITAAVARLDSDLVPDRRS
jgi:1-deoxy-D-xylulose-5-phosphate synthase